MEWYRAKLRSVSFEPSLPRHRREYADAGTLSLWSHWVNPTFSRHLGRCVMADTRTLRSYSEIMDSALAGEGKERRAENSRCTEHQTSYIYVTPGCRSSPGDTE